MALLTTHLLVARRWAQRHQEFENCPEFYLGAISPDAIHVRDGNDKSHKNEIHLNNWKALHADDVLNYWRERSAPFDAGYGVHVLTDAQWVPRFRSAFPELLLSDGKIDVSAYYRDTFYTDYALYREFGGAELFDLVGRGCAPADHPLLAQDELEAWKVQMIGAYKGECPKKEPARFIDRAFVLRFVEQCQPLLDEIWRRHEDE